MWGSSKVDTSFGNKEQSQSISADWDILGSGQASDTSGSWSSGKKKITKSDDIGTQTESNNANYSVSSSGWHSADVGYFSSLNGLILF
ncbi:hypothetical protein F511_21208 [Dorcoceras hygrometricum]|uniref:Uncharacterized protein n=1 Tax=Dorcoceras hygrometricum TaxID=472368 RepID=A0A2Z7CTY4_9LAMI|nr:hypothetical protein F511_21208 [Dorcoceras hygrometricum]